MKNPLRHATPWTLFLVAGLLLAGPASGAPAPAEQFVKERQTQLADLVRKGEDAEVHRVFSDTLDYETIARDSLGDAWGGLTAKQQEQFQCILRQLVARAYRRDLRRTLEYSITYQGTTTVDKGVIVSTVAKSKTNAREDPISIDYVVHQVGGNWKIRDIVTEGSSMVGSYEVQFRKLLKRKGFEEMMRKMQEKAGPDAAACG